MKDSVNRWLEDNKVKRPIVELFGTEECVRIAQMPGDRIQNLRTLYQKQLEGIAKFVRYFEMRDSKDRPVYDLFFATNHRLGHLKMKEAMWRVDPEGEFVFSDATDPNQTALFKIDNTPMLEKIIETEFKGKGAISGETIREFVEDKTAFFKTHMISVLKSLELSGRIKVEPLKTDGKKRRKNTYPDEVLITFI